MTPCSGTSSTCCTRLTMAAAPGCPQPDTSTSPTPRTLTTRACSSTGEPSQNSAAGSGGSNARPGASIVARGHPHLSGTVGQGHGGVGDQAWWFERVAGERERAGPLRVGATDVILVLVRQHHRRHLGQVHAQRLGVVDQGRAGPANRFRPVSNSSVSLPARTR